MVGLFELEVPEDHVRIRGVHQVLACSPSLLADCQDLDIIEDVLHV